MQRCGALPKLEATCLNRTVDEMRKEGFADDGLFPKIAEFFLPLTISEQELCIERGIDKQKRRMLIKDHKKLLADIKKKSDVYDEQNCIFWTYDDKITTLKKCRIDAHARYTQERSTMTARTNDGQQQQQKQQAQALQKLNEQWHQQEADLVRKISEEKKLKNDLEKVINKLEKEIDENKARSENIQMELAGSPKYVDKQLIKPARGLIMYGPPGKFLHISQNILYLFVFFFLKVQENRKL
jgi:hypothetical protein